MKKQNLLYAFFVAVFIIACNKEPGEGGTSIITGKLLVKEVNGFGQTLDQYYGKDKDVFIIYGTESKVYDDKFSTSYDGGFEFRNLTKGKYTIFAYTRCDTCGDGDTINKQVIEITENKSIIDIGDLEIIK